MEQKNKKILALACFLLILLTVGLSVGLLQLTTTDPVDGGWSQWGPWPDTCSHSCGEMERFRVCGSPSPVNGGKYCEGRNVEIQPCPCPVDGGWSQWGPWPDTCSHSCV